MKISDYFSSPVFENLPKDLIDSVYNDFGIIPGTVEVIGVKKKDLEFFNEFQILYCFPQSPEKLGENLIVLGNILTRIPPTYEIGIQEIDSSRPEGYYVLIYALENKE